MTKKILFAILLICFSLKGFSQYSDHDGWHMLAGWSYNFNKMPVGYWYQPSSDSIGSVYSDKFYFHHFVWRVNAKSDEMYLGIDAVILLDVAMHAIKGEELWQKNGRLKKLDGNLPGSTGRGVDWALFDFDMCFGGQKFYTGLHAAMRETGIRKLEVGDDIEKFENIAHARLGLSNFYFHENFRFGLKLDICAGKDMAGIGYSPSIMYASEDQMFFVSAYYRLTKLYRKDGIYEDGDAVLTPAQESIEIFKASTFGISAGFFL